MKKLITKNFLLYSVPSILSKLMPFATLPIMTKYLNLIDYGYFALFSLCLIPFLILTEYGAGYVIYSNWFDFNDNDRGKLVFSLLIVGTTLTLSIVLLFSLIGDTIFPIIIGENWNNIKSLKIYLFVTAFTYIPVTIFNYWVVIEKKAKLNVFIKGFEIIAGTSLTLYLTIYTQDYQFIIAGMTLTAIASSIVQFMYLIRIMSYSYEKRFFKLIFQIGSPIFIRSSFNHIRMQFDKIVVANLFGASQFALYNFAGRFNQIYGELNSNFSKAFQPIIFKGLAENNLDIESIRRTFFIWSYLTLLGCSFFIIFGKQIIDFLTNGMFTEAYPLLILYTCIVSIELLSLGNGEVVVHNKETKYLLFMTIVQALVMSSLALILIPKYGAPGGIIAYWSGIVVNVLMYFLKKQQLYKVWFNEKLALPYIFIFHTIVILKYFGVSPLVNYLLLIVIVIMTIHVWVINQRFFKEIFSKIKFRFTTI